MKYPLRHLAIIAFGAALAVAVGCTSSDEETIPRIAGEYDLAQVLTSSDACGLGDPIDAPITISQVGNLAVLTVGLVPGPDVCGAVSEGTVYSSRIFPASGETIFTDYFFTGCDLIQTDDWRLVMMSNGSVSGTWSVSFRDDPLDCSGPGLLFPCTNDYDVAGSACIGCAACPGRAAGSPQPPRGWWSKR